MVLKIFRKKAKVSKVQAAKKKVEGAFLMFTNAHKAVVEAIGDLRQAAHEHERNIQIFQQQINKESEAHLAVLDDIATHEQLATNLANFVPNK